jgi:hypothetical protein
MKIHAYLGDTVRLTLKDGSVLNGVVISKGIHKGVAIRSTLPSAHEWSFRAEDIASVQRSVPVVQSTLLEGRPW